MGEIIIIMLVRLVQICLKMILICSSIAVVLYNYFSSVRIVSMSTLSIGSRIVQFIPPTINFEPILIKPYRNNVSLYFFVVYIIIIIVISCLS